MFSPDKMMRDMLTSMNMVMPFGDPFAQFHQPPPNSHHRQHQQQHHHNPMSNMMMSPFMSGGGDPFSGLMNVFNPGMFGAGGNGSMGYCSSSVTSYTFDEHGRPQVYQQSSEVKQGPDGLKETKQSVRDSRTGHQELSIGHHLHDKAYIKKKSKNVYTGEEEQAEDLVNLEEEEAEAFEQNWRQKADSAMRHHANSYPNQIQCGSRSRNNASSNRLALTSSAQEDQRHHQKPSLTSPKRLLKSLKKKTKKNKDSGREAKV